MGNISVRKFEDKIWCHITLLVFLILVPVCAGYIDCRISCRRCHENKEHPSVLEVYCAMCAECKQRRREKLLRKNFTAKLITSSKPSSMNEMHSSESKKQTTPTTVYKDTTAETHPLGFYSPKMRMQRKLYSRIKNPKKYMQIGLRKRPVPIGWPEGCPTPPPCSGSDSDEDAKAGLSYRTTDIPENQEPSTCPPAPQCSNKFAETMATCIPCMPMCPCPDTLTQNTQKHLKATESATTTVTITSPTSQPPEYHYVYVGLPVDVLRRG